MFKRFAQFLTVVRAIETDTKVSPSRQLATAARQGQQISRQHRPDYNIVLFMVLLIIIGSVLIYAIGPQTISQSIASRQENQLRLFYKHVAGVIIAGGVFAYLGRVDLAKLQKWAFKLLVFGFACGVLLWVLAVLPFNVPIIKCVNGACRWFAVPFLGMTIQVSEIMKFSLIIFLTAFWKYFNDRQQLNSRFNLLYSGLILGFGLVLIVVAQNDLGTGISLLMIALAMAWVANIRTVTIVMTIVILALAGGLAVVAKPHRVARVMTFLEGDNVEINDRNRHIINAKIAIGSGGLTGLGIGKSIQSTGYLPEAINDSIFAIIGEMFGFIGAVAVVLLYISLILKLLKNVAYSHVFEYRLLLTGAATWIFSHFFINTTSMLGIAPMTGITLPFLSYGGTSLIFAAGVLGLAFNASRFTAYALYNVDRRG